MTGRGDAGPGQGGRTERHPWETRGSELAGVNSEPVVLFECQAAPVRWRGEGVHKLGFQGGFA